MWKIIKKIYNLISGRSKKLYIMERSLSELMELTKTDRYKNSDYVIEIVNGKHGIRYKPNGKYVDLNNNAYKWEYGQRFTEECFGNPRDVLKAFYFLCPIIEPLIIEKVY